MNAMKILHTTVSVWMVVVVVSADAYTASTPWAHAPLPCVVLLVALIVMAHAIILGFIFGLRKLICE
jgi:hypothetical protein